MTPIRSGFTRLVVWCGSPGLTWTPGPPIQSRRYRRQCLTVLMESAITCTRAATARMLQNPRMANCGSCVSAVSASSIRIILPFNKLPPPVHIEQVTADDKIYDATNGLRLPPLIRNLAIDYTALSFVAPEKVRFRYKLEGQNRNWHEVVNDRQVQYTNLAPGTYRFRVMASNNSGVWNETGATLDFSIAPAYYQTRWFAALLVAIATRCSCGRSIDCASAQIARQFNRTLDARVSERTRIARDLHDTLLQSFQGALLRFQSARTCSRRVPKRRGSGWSRRWTRQKRRSPKGATPCRDCVPRRRR